MFFTEDFISELAENPAEGARKAIEMVRNNFDPGSGYTDDDYEKLLECYALIEGLIEAHLLDGTNLPQVNLSLEPALACVQIQTFLSKVDDACRSFTAVAKFDSLKSKIQLSLNKGFCYEFSQGDLDRIQHLVNDLRKLIADSEALHEEHRGRLLKRLEKMQSELHKKVSDLDRFWGLIGDAGVVVGKLGTDAKPIVDRIKEIADIVWQTQARTEELPSGTNMPLLGSKSKSLPE